MKCNNPNHKCSGDIRPIGQVPGSSECNQCGYRVPTPKDAKPEPKKLDKEQKDN
jgi:hypothetical protein